MTPYRIEAFGELVIPSDWVFYTPIAGRLHAANNEEALADLIRLISCVRRSRAIRYQAIMGKGMTTNFAGKERYLR